ARGRAVGEGGRGRSSDHRRSAGWLRSGRLRRLGLAGGPRGGRVDRCATRPVQRGRAELGPAARRPPAAACGAGAASHLHRPRRVLAAITNHDLPTIAGAWTWRDLTDQRAAGIDVDARQIAWWRNRIAGLAGLPPTARIEDVILAAHRTLAASPACLVSATLE